MIREIEAKGEKKSYYTQCLEFRFKKSVKMYSLSNFKKDFYKFLTN